MPSRRNKKGWFFSVLKNHPVNSALPGAKRNIPYAELGIRAISTREMAKEAGCLDLYNFAYTGWSHAAHGTWNHIGRFDALPSDEPLHKHVWQPANLEHGKHIDVVVQGTKYFDELCVLIVGEYRLKMDIPNPNAWLEERLNMLFSETEDNRAA